MSCGLKGGLEEPGGGFLGSEGSGIGIGEMVDGQGRSCQSESERNKSLKIK
jgi:hypothetical protein